jgi:hypothetical protein
MSAISWHYSASQGLATCGRCGQSFPVAQRPRRLPEHDCSGPPLAAVRSVSLCRHRGPEVDRVLCLSCEPKKVLLKVFACTEFGKCMLERSLPAIHACRGCQRYESELPESASVSSNCSKGS